MLSLFVWLRECAAYERSTYSISNLRYTAMCSGHCVSDPEQVGFAGIFDSKIISL